MRIVLSADMEGISGIRDVRELLACCPQYWSTGRARFTADIAAAAAGLLDGGAREVVILDNHASGSPSNLLADALPNGARIATWNVFDLPELGIDGLLQVGYHPRRGVPGFAPHTYIPGLRLWLDDEEISESHGRAWAASAPLLGIIGHANHGTTLGSLAETRFLAVQQGEYPHHSRPVFVDPAEGSAAIRAFAREAMRDILDAPRPAIPGPATFTASLDRPICAQVDAMLEGGWALVDDGTFEVRLRRWADAREPLAAAMNAAFRPFLSDIQALDLSSQQAIARQDASRFERLISLFLDRLLPAQEASTTNRPQAAPVRPVQSPQPLVPTET